MTLRLLALLQLLATSTANAASCAQVNDCHHRSFTQCFTDASCASPYTGVTGLYVSHSQHLPSHP